MTINFVLVVGMELGAALAAYRVGVISIPRRVLQ